MYVSVSECGKRAKKVDRLTCSPTIALVKLSSRIGPRWTRRKLNNQIAMDVSEVCRWWARYVLEDGKVGAGDDPSLLILLELDELESAEELEAEDGLARRWRRGRGGEGNLRRL
jgi:hypothetical protein